MDRHQDAILLPEASVEAAVVCSDHGTAAVLSQAFNTTCGVKARWVRPLDFQMHMFHRNRFWVVDLESIRSVSGWQDWIALTAHTEGLFIIVVLNSLSDIETLQTIPFETTHRVFLPRRAGADAIAGCAQELLRQVNIIPESEVTACAPEVTDMVSEAPDSQTDVLAPRQAEIASLVTNGYTNVEVARFLGVGQTTVKTHLQRIFCKLNVSSRAALAAVWSQRGA